MTRATVVCAASAWLGTTLVLSGLPWVNRPSLATRLRPFASGVGPRQSTSGTGLREELLRLFQTATARLQRLLGVEDQAAIRLHRIHAPIDVTELRLRQLRSSALASAVALVLSTAVRPPLHVAVLMLGGGALLGFLIVEQQLAAASDRWQQRLRLELPIVSEQLGMLIGAGFSLSTALNRIAARGSGACAQDLARVGRRIRQGLSEPAALREWAEIADVDSVSRLVSLLALHREAGDLSSLVAEEARSLRRDAQRRLIERVERRAQQVWIPVTVAALVPGAVLLAIPFIDALRLFSTT